MRVSFTGHRPDKISGWTHTPQTVEQTIRKAVAEEIVALCEEGAHTFVSGMAPGFDLWAADEVLRLRECGAIPPTTRLVAAIPYPRFECSFDATHHPLYHHIEECADKRIHVSPHYHRGCFAKRNDLLVEMADVVVAYYEGTEGGTRYTLRRAKALGRECRNLHMGNLF